MYKDERTMNKTKSLEDRLYWIGVWFFLLSVVLFSGYYYLQSSGRITFFCFWDRFLHLYCPGCGGTRAVEALVHGDILMSLWYHPLVIYSVVIFAVFMISQTFARVTRFRYTKGVRFHNWFLFAALGILILNFVEKNLLRSIWHIML
jgi:hypothetical protein